MDEIEKVVEVESFEILEHDDFGSVSAAIYLEKTGWMDRLRPMYARKFDDIFTTEFCLN